MACMLRPDLSSVTGQGRTVFLDHRANRYFALSVTADAIFEQFRQRPLDRAERDRLHPLFRDGLISGDPLREPLLLAEPLSAPRTELALHAQCTWALVIRSGAAQMRSRRQTRDLSFSAIGATLDRSRRDACRSVGRSDELACAAIVAAFERMDLLFQPLDRCLPRALAFCQEALRQGLAATLVIGVRPNPFAAHAWVQLGDMVVNDRLEQVRQFMPIATL